MSGSIRSSSSAAAAVFGRNAGKLVVFLCIVPSVLTYFHLQQQLLASPAAASQDLLIVRYTSANNNNSNARGLYGRSRVTGFYHKLLFISGSSRGVFVPDVLDAAAAAVQQSPPQSLMPYLVVRAGKTTAGEKFQCLHAAAATTAVADTNSAVSSCGDNDLVYETMLHTNPSNNHQRIMNKRSAWYLVTSEIPATSLLLALNVLLAFLYWNGHVPVMSVAKVYSNMVSVPFEIWRSLTGATAHFEIWHLGFNMMSLLALGKELEGGHLQSSVSFFFYNLSLIPIVAAIWLGFQWAAQKYFPGNSHMADPNRPTVGYSGVLFAWMVVAALEQQSTCPIIFFPTLCFRTYSFGGGAVKFSFGPLVQLAVMQVILPRVSFTGHLAGIVAGFLLHWGLLPIRYVQPAILIPALYLVYLRTIRNAIPAFTNPADSTDAFERSLNVSCESAPRRALLLFRCQLTALACSVAVLGPLSSLSLSFAVTVVYWFYFCQASDGKPSDAAAVVLAKGYIVAAVLVLITDAMTCGSWGVFYAWEPYPVAVMMLRALILLASMNFAVQVQIHQQEEGGIFEWTLGYTTLQPCRALVGHPWLPKLAAVAVARSATAATAAAAETDIEAGSSWAPFMGGGRRLGGGSSPPRRITTRDEEHSSNTQELSRLL